MSEKPDIVKRLEQRIRDDPADSADLIDAIDEIRRLRTQLVKTETTLLDAGTEILRLQRANAEAQASPPRDIVIGGPEHP